LSTLLLIILVSYFLVCFISFTFLLKLRFVISYHLGMNIAMTSSGVMGIAVGALLGNTFPASYTFITVITTILAIIIGAIFGALVDYQTLLSGISSGLMAGIMGPMIGVMSGFGMIMFCTFLVYVMFALICFSVRS